MDAVARCSTLESVSLFDCEMLTLFGSSGASSRGKAAERFEGPEWMRGVFAIIRSKARIGDAKKSIDRREDPVVDAASIAGRSPVDRRSMMLCEVFMFSLSIPLETFTFFA